MRENVEDQSSTSPGDGSRGGFDTGKLMFVFRGGLAQGTAASHPFGDSHAVSRITDINVNDVDQGDMTAYQDEVTDGRL